MIHQHQVKLYQFSKVILNICNGYRNYRIYPLQFFLVQPGVNGKLISVELKYKYIYIRNMFDLRGKMVEKRKAIYSILMRYEIGWDVYFFFLTEHLNNIAGFQCDIHHPNTRRDILLNLFSFQCSCQNCFQIYHDLKCKNKR